MKSRSFAIILAAALGACSAEGIGTEIEMGAADAGTPDDIIGSVELNVDAPLPSTYWGSVPMTGHGPPNGTLLFSTPGGGQFTEELGATGDFCVDVILQKDTVNTVKFEAINTNGQYSEPVFVDIRQEGQPPDVEPGDDPEPGYSNIAAGSTIQAMSVSVEEGSVAALVDGDSSAAVSLRNANTSVDWMVIELKERLPIQQVHIQTTQDCPLESYRILLNDDPQSGDPLVWSWWPEGAYVYGDGWTMIANVSGGGTDQTITPAIGDPLAHRMAIQFLSSDCGPVVGSGRHRITEIEVWGRGQNTPGQPTGNGAPSCTSGF